LLTYNRGGKGDGQAAAALGLVSPVAWQHINLYGRYEFNKRPDLVDMAAIIEELAKLQVTTELAPDI